MKPSISIKTSLILLLPALSSIALLWVFSSFLTKVESEALFTDIAGRQRMLSEQLYKFSHMVHIGQQDENTLPYAPCFAPCLNRLNLFHRLKAPMMDAAG